MHVGRYFLLMSRLASTILLHSHDVEYDHTATIITIQPEALTGVTSSPKQAHDSKVTITVVTDSAKDFTTASAYLYTAVTAIPVHALTKTTPTAAALYPSKKLGVSGLNRFAA